jgi:transposase
MRPVLSRLERAELVRRATDPQRPLDARRARAVLLISGGAGWTEVMRRLRCSRGFIARWLKRFNEARLGGLRAQHHGSEPDVLTPAMESRIVRAGAHRTADGALRWSTRTLARHLGVSHMTVQRVWTRHEVRPPEKREKREVR